MCHPERAGPLVHPDNEAVDVTPDELRDLRRRVVGALDRHRLQQILKRKGLPRIEPDNSGARHLQNRPGDFNRRIQ